MSFSEEKSTKDEFLEYLIKNLKEKSPRSLHFNDSSPNALSF
jgi:hypothetical protein